SVRLNFTGYGIGNETFFIPAIEDLNGTRNVTGEFTEYRVNNTLDYTTFTVSDPDSDLTINATQITIDTMNHRQDTYLVRALDTNISGDFTLNTSFMTTVDGNPGIFYIGLANGGTGRINAQTDFIAFEHYDIDQIRIHNEGGVSSTTLDLNTNIRYWITLERVSGTVYLKVYSDASRTTQVGSTISLADSGTYTHVYALSSDNYGTLNHYHSGYIYELEEVTGMGTTPITIATGSNVTITDADNNTNYTLYYENQSIYAQITNNESVLISIQKPQNTSQTPHTNATIVRMLIPANISITSVVYNGTVELATPQNYTYNTTGPDWNILTINLTDIIHTVGDLINITVEGRTPYYFTKIFTDPPRILINNTLNTSQDLYIEIQGDPSLFINSTVQHQSGVTWLERGTTYTAGQAKYYYFDPDISIFPASGATIKTLAYHNTTQVLDLTLEDTSRNNGSYIWLADKAGSSISCTMDGQAASPEDTGGSGWNLSLTFSTAQTVINCAPIHQKSTV
ncbi:MAG: hypothetical protein GXO65_00190, partial [Euryarchaeota archaeon]|nr:hypothetical protein [Euryarchaeota archaeon]